MQKKLNIIQIVTILAYLWIVATLPLHSHQSDLDRDSHEQCSHAENHEHQDNQDHCIICINIHHPSAINKIDFIEISVLVIDYYPSYNTERVITNYDKYNSHPTNKDPPYLMIS